MKTVTTTLQEIGAGDKEVITIFNKIDAYSFVKKDEDDLTPSGKENITLKQLQKTWMSKTKGHCMFISATEKENIVELKKMLYDKVKEMHIKRYPYNNLLY